MINEDKFKSNEYIRIISSYYMFLLDHVNAQLENSFINSIISIKIIIMAVEIMMITIIQVVMIIFLLK